MGTTQNFTEVLFTPEPVNGKYAPVIPPEPLWPKIDSTQVIQPEGILGHTIAGSPTGPFIQYMAITPQIAKEILTVCHNPNNRKIQPRRVSTYARIMRKGKWNITHQGLAFAGEFGNSTLDDGQHRLKAVIESGTTQVFAVSTYMRSFATADTGKTRNFTDILSMAGFKDPAYLGSAIRLIQVYDKTSRPWQVSKQDLTHAEAVEYADVMADGISPLIHYARGTVSRLGKGSPTALLAGLYIVDRWAKRNEEFLTERGLNLPAWMEGLKTGAGLGVDKGDARLALCNWIVKSSKMYSAQMASDLTMLSTLRVFKAYCDGKTLSNLYFPEPSTYMFRLPGDTPKLSPAGRAEDTTEE
jgi:hypothetical protein